MNGKPPRVAVFGAGAFGGWTALELVRRGADVTLIDAWGPGHARSSSGGATRIIRATYGSHARYTRMATDALRRWQAHEARWRADLFRQSGALWLFSSDTGFAAASAQVLNDHGIPLDEVSLADAARRYPQVSFAGVSRVMIEPRAGYLFASRACRHVAERVVTEGGTCRIGAAAAPAAIDDRGVRLVDGSTVAADYFVFACGPWLGGLFPDIIGRLIAPTRQEVYYFGLPAGDSRFGPPALPVWLDCGERFVYGIPAADGRGFKVAEDSPGPPIDSTTDERTPSMEGIQSARAYLARRFPDLRKAPLIGAEVCQYESTPDSHFIIDRHPADSRVWIAGGGSGHGFKMGPAIGEMLASAILSDATPDPGFGLARFAVEPPGGWQPKWA